MRNTLRRALETEQAATQKPRAWNPWTMPQHPPGVGGPDEPLAMDEDINDVYHWAGHQAGALSEGLGFFGYTYLAELSQRSEYRQPCEVLAEEMTRKWCVLKAAASTDKTDKIRELTEDMNKFHVREMFRQAYELDGIMGISFLAPTFEDSHEKKDLTVPFYARPEFVKKGSLRGFTLVDPTWCAPNRYNSWDPFDPTFYRPQTWFVMTREVHASRLIMFRSRPVPQILLPAYNFGGMSLIQLMHPVTTNWLETRQGVNSLIQSFTQWTLATNLQAMLGEAGDMAQMRYEMFNATRNNRGLLVTDKDTEQLGNISAPLGGLDHLQAQAQEHQAAPARIPIVKMFGYGPSGLNASSDGEIRGFYDSIHGKQERDFNAPLTYVLNLLQLNRYGEIDPEITHEWLPLYELDEAGKASVQKTKVDTDAVLSQIGVIGPDEIRQRIANDPESVYHGLEGEAPGPPEGGEEVQGEGEDPTERVDTQAEEGSHSGANAADGLGYDGDSQPLQVYRFGPIDVYIETLKGQVRQGRSGRWAIEMPADYGYIKGFEGADGDSIDAFVGDGDARLDPVFVIEQHRLTGEFDEHKVMLGFPTRRRALACYDASFTNKSGAQRRKVVKQLTFAELVEWLKSLRLAEDKEFVESEHPRDADGKFGSGNGGGEGKGSKRAALTETKVVDGKRVQADGSPLPAHVEKLKLPPAWTDVRYSDDPSSDLLAVGKDSKGRVQAVYSDAFSAAQSAAKFERIHELSQKFGYISKQNAEAQRSTNPKTRDSADCLDLIMKMGVRPGSETDTGAKVKAYGATTLEGRHVVVDDTGNVTLRFVGKKGVNLDLPVADAPLAKMLVKRAKVAGKDGKLFSNTNDKALLDYVHTLDGGGFKTKDFRTHLGTKTAYALVQKLPAPKTEKDYKRSVMEVAKHVSQKLGNTPTIALQSYISPTVFAAWRGGLA